MAGPSVRRLVERDIDAAIELTDLEEWGYTRADFARLLTLAPRGCFAAEDAGRIVGVLTTTSYGKLAFLGAVIVHPTLRGRGVGRLLMDAALEHLNGTGVETVRLNAYLDVIPFYEKLGFHREYDVVRWRADLRDKGSRTTEAATDRDVDDLAAFDVFYFGANRKALLTRLREAYPETFLVARDGGRILGYLVGSPYDGRCEIGPWVVAPGHPEAALALIDRLVEVTGPREYAFTGPARNPELQRFVADAGFAEVFRTVRMWWGKNRHPGDPAGVWAAGGLEKG